MEQDLQNFIRGFENKIIELSEKGAQAYFDASISGKSGDFEKAAEYELKIQKIFSDNSDFKKLKKIKESGTIKDTLLNRQLILLYNHYLGMQIDPHVLEKMIRLQSKNEQIFSVFRAEVNDKKLTDNEIDEILKTSLNQSELRATWIASKKIGQLVYDDVMQLIWLRNKSARDLGFDNFHSMSLILDEQDPDQIDLLFDQLDELTADTYADIKTKIDKRLADKFKIKAKDLRPWHYHDRFFQNAPPLFELNIDKYYKGKDLVRITRNFFEKIKIPVDDLLSKSDLYEKPGKYQHAYCIDINRKGDIRVVCNIKPTASWMNTMLHEFGHAVYYKYINKSLPWLLRNHAHTFTTEAVAMFFGRMAYQAEWIDEIFRIAKSEYDILATESGQLLKEDALVFSRWAQVMYRFEKSMYKKPEQDLDKLWWDLMEKYQLLKKPEDAPEHAWAAKIHLSLYPAYYHNYMLGELLASQFRAYFQKKYSVKNKDLYDIMSRFFKNNFFYNGNKYQWDKLVKKTTGEKFSAQYFAREYI